MQNKMTISLFILSFYISTIYTTVLSTATGTPNQTACKRGNCTWHTPSDGKGSDAGLNLSQLGSLNCMQQQCIIHQSPKNKNQTKNSNDVIDHLQIERHPLAVLKYNLSFDITDPFQQSLQLPSQNIQRQNGKRHNKRPPILKAIQAQQSPQQPLSTPKKVAFGSVTYNNLSPQSMLSDTNTQTVTQTHHQPQMHAQMNGVVNSGVKNISPSKQNKQHSHSNSNSSSSKVPFHSQVYKKQQTQNQSPRKNARTTNRIQSQKPPTNPLHIQQQQPPMIQSQDTVTSITNNNSTVTEMRNAKYMILFWITVGISSFTLILVIIALFLMFQQKKRLKKYKSVKKRPPTPFSRSPVANTTPIVVTTQTQTQTHQPRRNHSYSVPIVTLTNQKNFNNRANSIHYRDHHTIDFKPSDDKHSLKKKMTKQKKTENKKEQHLSHC